MAQLHNYFVLFATYSDDINYFIFSGMEIYRSIREWDAFCHYGVSGLNLRWSTTASATFASFLQHRAAPYF